MATHEDEQVKMPRNKGAMFWISLALLAMFPLTLAAILVMGWLAIYFK
jgi:hypothetical protein